MTPALLMLALVQGAAAPDLGWLAGYWLSCEDGREVSETWSDPRGGNMLGTSLTTSDGKVSFEQARIGPSPSGLSFFAQPSGQSPAEFSLKEAEPWRVVFENAAHDFPQRVIYRREGDRLLARIEGRIEGKERSAEWRYAAAPLNRRCPPAEAAKR